MYAESLGLKRNGICEQHSNANTIFANGKNVKFRGEKRYFLDMRMLINYLDTIILISLLMWLKEIYYMRSDLFYIMSLLVLIFSFIFNHKGVVFLYKNVQGLLLQKG